MSRAKNSTPLHSPGENPFEEVLLLADMVGKSKTTLAEVARDFITLVKDPIIAGGFAMAFYGFVRATVDIDVLAIHSTKTLRPEFIKRGYKYESVQLPIGSLELLTKGNKGIDFIHLNNADFLASLKSRAVPGDFFGKPVRFVSLEDLIVLKSLAVLGRTKNLDLVDLEELLKLPHDADYVARWRP